MVKMEIQPVVDQLPRFARPLSCEGLVAGLKLEIQRVGDQLVPLPPSPCFPALHATDRCGILLLSIVPLPTPPNR